MATILVTGATGGLGSPVVNLLLQDENKVIAFVHSEESKRKLPVHKNLTAVVADLSDEESVAANVEQLISQFKTIDAAVLLAGGYAGGNILATSVKNIQEQIALNFITGYTIVKALLPHFKTNKKGRLVLTGSQPPLMPAKAKYSVAYTLSKSLIFQLADILNEETKGTDIVTTVIVPSIIDTAANRKAMPDADFTKWVKPEQVAGAIQFVLSDKASAWREPVVKLYNQS